MTEMNSETTLLQRVELVMDKIPGLHTSEDESAQLATNVVRGVFRPMIFYLLDNGSNHSQLITLEKIIDALSKVEESGIPPDLLNKARNTIGENPDISTLSRNISMDDKHPLKDLRQQVIPLLSPQTRSDLLRADFVV